MTITWSASLALQAKALTAGPILGSLGTCCYPCSGLFGFGCGFAQGYGCAGVCAFAAFGGDASADLYGVGTRAGQGCGESFLPFCRAVVSGPTCFHS